MYGILRIFSADKIVSLNLKNAAKPDSELNAL